MRLRAVTPLQGEKEAHMSKVGTGTVTPAVSAKKESFKNVTWKHFAPLVAAIVIALIAAPAGLPQYA